MFEEKDRVTVQIHQDLKEELDKRKEFLTTNYIPNGGIRTASLLAAFELKLIRQSKEELKKEFLSLEKPKIFNFDCEPYVKMEDYIKLFNFAAIINKRKDKQQINVDFSKLKGMKKNDVKISW